MEYPLLERLRLPSDIKALSYDELDALAEETRQFILNTVSQNGGHLAPNLGVVELTLALLRTTEPMTDRIIWDVSHQSYPFKILTDRYRKFHTLRQFGGISGFTKPEESPYDAFVAGHASTSISAGLGIAAADALLKRTRKVVSIIGDGSLTGGMAFEGLNNLGASGLPMVVILNDNEMSIGHNVGALSSTLSRMLTGERSTALRRDIKKFLESMPAKIANLARKTEEGLLSFFTNGILFEELGLRYIGPIDGHKVREVEKALTTAFQHNRPVLIHVATVKGKGYSHAEEHPENYHGISSFNIETGKPKKFNGDKTWTDAFGEKLTEMAADEPRIVAITAAMRDGTGLKGFAEKYPERFFDVGIAEEHAVTFAAGLAISGIRPYIALYSSFLQRGYDQLIHDVAQQNLPVTFCIDRAGLVGEDGSTHHGAFDTSYLRTVPGLTVFLPKDLYELDRMLEASLTLRGPSAIRYPRGAAASFELPLNPIVIGEAEFIKKGGETAIVSAGHIFTEAFKFHTMLEQGGRKAALINLRFAKPLNKESLINELKDKTEIFCFEENIRSGGIGEMLATLLLEAGITAKLNIISLGNDFITHGAPHKLRELVGITAEKVYEAYVKSK